MSLKIRRKRVCVLWIFARRLITRFYQDIQSRRSLANDYNSRKHILDAFPEPADYLERSYFQYLCQNKSLPKVIRIIQNFFSALFFPIYWVFFQATKVNSSDQADAIYLSDGIGMEIIPESLKNKYYKIISCDYNGKMLLKKTEKNIMKLCFRRYWHAPFFCLKCLFKICLYANYINIYHPKALIVYNEYSFTSSMLTEYCKTKGIEHINIQHGERMFNLRDTFVEYDKFYVWDDHYQKLFVSMLAAPRQFEIELPAFLKTENSFEESNEPMNDFTYYLGMERKEALLRIRQCLENLQNAGKRVCIRLHPRFSFDREVRQIFCEYPIEDANAITISE